MRHDPIYLDHAATTPVSPAVLEAMLPYLGNRFGNPSSAHRHGDEARDAVSEARGGIARLLGVSPDELVFTAGGSEANNLALKGVAWALRARGGHIVTSAVEHHAVLGPCRFLEDLGFRVTVLPVDGTGRVDPDDVRKAVTPETVLVSVMHANNEVGTVQPLVEIGRIAKEREILFHTDAVQAFGSLPIPVDEAGIDLLSVSGHKFYGPKGVGFLYVRKGTPLLPLVHGGGQERHRRAGTENVPGIVGIAKAAALVLAKACRETVRQSRLRDRLIAGVTESIEGAVPTGHPVFRLPNNASFCIEGVEGESLVLELAQRGIHASSGSACSSGSGEPSHVLSAMGTPPELAHGMLRLTVGESTDDDAVDTVLDVLPVVVRRLRGITGMTAGNAR